MKKRLLGLFLMLCAVPFLVKAQEYLPFINSPYAGVTAGQVNPASIAGSKYKFDVTLFGASAGAHNDLFVWSRKKEIFNINFYKDLMDNFSDFRNLDASNDLKDVVKHYLPRTGVDWGEGPYSGSFSGRMDVLNMMYSFTDRFSMGIGYSYRFIGSVKDIPEVVAYNTLKGYVPMSNVTTVNGATSAASVSIFNQVSLTGAYTIVDNETNKLKLGLTAKLLFGGHSGFAYMDGYNVTKSNTTSTKSGRGEAGVSENGKFGIAGDIGLEYEYRPAELAGNEIANYRFKAGVSLLDFGGYKNDIKAGDGDRYSNLDLGKAGSSGSPTSISGLINEYGTTSAGDDFKTSLPSVIAGQFDYRFGASPIFLAFNPYIALNQGSAKKAFTYTSFNLVPHAEWKNFGVSVPIQYDQYGKFTAGLGLRAWRHIWIGSNTILKNLSPFSNEAGKFTANYSADIHVMVKVPIMKADNDRDGDGVPDNIDRCPDTPGLKKFQGCPDTDGDGIPDIDDACPNEPGPAALKGCPDRDGDGIADKDDRCPDQPGPAEFQGCPDTDGDGIPDIDDACPTEAGPKATKGCPDRDGDGIADKDDRCPDQAGPASLQGCPDRDGDGVPDIDDACPDEPGTKANKGCPETGKIQNVEFDFDKYVVKPQYYSELDKVVEIMTKDPSVRVNIVGHTDNIGTKQYNMNLSKKRAEAVRSYLLKKKAESKRISTEYYGFDRPVADNNTDAGRAKNRRAEITIVVK